MLWVERRYQDEHDQHRTGFGTILLSDSDRLISNGVVVKS
jgi:hypothetical protein